MKRKRKDVRNGYRSRDFGAIYGVIEDIKIPRARNSSFTTWILPHFKRRTGRIGRLISQIFLRGLSTRPISEKITYLYLDEVDLPLRRNRASKEAIKTSLQRLLPVTRPIWMRRCGSLIFPTEYGSLFELPISSSESLESFDAELR